MGLLNHILTWTETALTLWQRDAARRLFQKPEGLDEQDFNELFVLLKAAHNLPNPTNLQPFPLASTHLPSTINRADMVLLKTMRNLRYVNRIAQGQILNFSPSGITVIYGENSSGKSGYSRVLKRACRARDQAEKVLPDANDPNSLSYIPEAFFDIEVGNNSKSVKWSADAVPPDELSTIAVFDTHCARAYLTSKQEIAYLPYGLDVVENLANKVLPELNTRLNQEIDSVSVDKEPFKHLIGETEVGMLISDLSDKTDPIKVKKLATLTKEQVERIKDLNQALSEADPIAKAKELRLSAQRLKELEGRLMKSLSWVSDDAINRLKSLDEASVVAIQAEKIAAIDFRSGESLLPGTGDPTWKVLFDAARNFSLEVAYPGHEFPHVGDGALCPLCQQTVDAAAERLKRFDIFVKDDAAKVAEEKRKQIETAIKKIEAANLSVGLEGALSEEIASIDGDLVVITKEFEKTIYSRQAWMLEAVKSHFWEQTPILAGNPRQQIRNLAADQFKAARTLEKAADENNRKKLEIEYYEQHARQRLSVSLNSVLALIERMKLKSSLASCKNDLNTKPISYKSKEFASNAFTETFKKALEEEFKTLGIDHIRTKLDERNEKGKMKYQLLLDLPSGCKIENILSEGEQRAFALASFLAELRLANHCGGIIFDDPVSSLDHHRRQNVAKRLVKEAEHRQVVIFTHDTTFLGELRDVIDQSPEIGCTLQYLECLGGSPGYVCNGLPWGHMSYKERIDQLEKTQKTLEKKPWPAYPNEDDKKEMCHAYDLLRATIERVIQDVVFCGVIKRYRDWVRVNLLADVVDFDNAEYEEINRLYDKCHKVITGHDQSSQKNPTVPTATELGLDLKNLINVIETISNRRKAPKATKSRVAIA